MHTFASFCSEGSCIATEFCPVEETTQIGVLNHVRENYGPSIVAEDDIYTITGMEKAIGLQPVIAEDGTEVYPEVIGCPVHTMAAPEIGADDPSDPNYIPPVEGEGDVTPPPEEPVVPEIPTPPPTEPSEPTEPSGGENEDWWDDLWEEPA